jgi:dipeptidase E
LPIADYPATRFPDFPITRFLNLLLLSNSSSPAGYLTHALPWIVEVLGGRRRIAFVPYAGVTFEWDDYADSVRHAMEAIDVEVASVHESDDPRSVIVQSDAVFVGGGNTFALLRALHANGLVEVIRTRVENGGPYVGWSAGANVACPTIRTTNDMPIVEPPTLDALGLVPFQINPHYTDAHPPGHRGETRAERLAEFVEMNPGLPVVGLPEGTALRVGRLTVESLGPEPVRLFEHRMEPRILEDPDLSFLLVGGSW